MTSISPLFNQELEQLRKINGSLRFTEVKVQKMCILNFVMIEIWQGQSREDLLSKKKSKNAYWKFDHRDTLRQLSFYVAKFVFG